jgi:hypothetical protein
MDEATPTPLSPDDPCPIEAKVRHRSRRAAELVIKKQRQSRPKTPPLRAYQCEACHDWHLTSATGKPGKRRRF